MLPLQLSVRGRTLRVLCLGAHSDDIEIGCAGTLLRLLDVGYELHLTWVVLSAVNSRANEARRSAKHLLRRATDLQVCLGSFPDTQFQSATAELKTFMTSVRDLGEVDLIFTHSLEDRHQDHRLTAELTWQAWRNHLILEYEVPKYEGMSDRPNFFVPLSRAIVGRKIRHLLSHFGSQRSKDWFTEETFQAVMRLRGVECRAASGFAESFTARKVVL